MNVSQSHRRKSITTLTFGNDDKSRQNKSHNEITVQLCAKVATFSGLKVKYTESMLPWVRIIGTIISNFFFLHLFIIKLHRNLPEYI